MTNERQDSYRDGGGYDSGVIFFFFCLFFPR